MSDFFTAKTFQLPELMGISAKNVEEHLKLYAGYVKFANYVQNQIESAFVMLVYFSGYDSIHTTMMMPCISP